MNIDILYSKIANKSTTSTTDNCYQLDLSVRGSFIEIETLAAALKSMFSDLKLTESKEVLK